MIHFDAHADTGDIEFGSLIGHGQPMRRLIESGAVRGDRFLQVGLRGYWPGTGDARLDGRAGHALVRDDRDRRARPRRVPHRGVRDRHRRLRRRVPLRRHRRLRPRPRARHRHPGAGRPHRAPAARRGAPHRLRAAGRRRRRRRGLAALRPRRDHLGRWPTGSCWRRCPASPAGARMPAARRPGTQPDRFSKVADLRAQTVSRSVRSVRPGRLGRALRAGRAASSRSPRIRPNRRRRRSRPVSAMARGQR